jgi:SAM-dependent methyltransferase
MLARAGKRVLRPGGVELSDRLLHALSISPRDTVIELAPGLGHTAEKVIARGPISYLGVDREPSVVAELNRRLSGEAVRFVEGVAEDTGLPGETATVLFGEAMLSMQPTSRKKLVIEEAWRLLRRGGRYGIHELCLQSDALTESSRKQMEADLSQTIHHGVCVPSPMEWYELMESAGFRVKLEMRAPMALLDPTRIIQDEGWLGALRFGFNVLRCGEARRRVSAMRSVFRHYRKSLQAICLVCEKEY